MVHALVVEDNEEVLDQVCERLDSLGHTCDTAETQDEARRLLSETRYAYVLLDLETPVRYGRLARLDNGKNLLREIRATNGYAQTPVVVMTAHGHQSYRLSSEVLRLGGADDFLAKPFRDGDQVLEKAITDVLRSNGRSRTGTESQSIPHRDSETPQPFEEGKMAFYPSRVELCGVKLCSDQGMIRQILDILQCPDRQGRRRAYSGEELAEMIETEGGPTAIAGAIRNFRNRAKKIILSEANVIIDPAVDLIVNDRHHGYRISEKITVVERRDLLASHEDVGLSNEIRVTQLPPKPSAQDSHADWLLTELRRTGRLRKSQVIQRTGWSDSTARRTLAKLRENGQIVFEGSARSGYWRAA